MKEKTLMEKMVKTENFEYKMTSKKRAKCRLCGEHVHDGETVYVRHYEVGKVYYKEYMNEGEVKTENVVLLAHMGCEEANDFCKRKTKNFDHMKKYFGVNA